MSGHSNYASAAICCRGHIETYDLEVRGGALDERIYLLENMLDEEQLDPADELAAREQLEAL
jgi:hypothetical protein